MESRHIESAVHILRSVRYATIATVCEDGSPWNTPVSASIANDLSIFWGSSPDNVHSRNIRNDGRAFVVLFDSNAPEGTGEGLYFSGKAKATHEESEDITLFSFLPEHVWINDEAKNGDGEYKHDIRVEIPLEKLKEAFQVTGE